MLRGNGGMLRAVAWRPAPTLPGSMGGSARRREQWWRGRGGASGSVDHRRLRDEGDDPNDGRPVYCTVEDLSEFDLAVAERRAVAHSTASSIEATSQIAKPATSSVVSVSPSHFRKEKLAEFERATELTSNDAHVCSDGRRQDCREPPGQGLCQDRTDEFPRWSYAGPTWNDPSARRRTLVVAGLALSRPCIGGNDDNGRGRSRWMPGSSHSG